MVSILISMMGRQRRKAALSRRGFSILEVLIAAILLLVVFFALASTYSKGRRQMAYEEDRRRATALAQSVLDGIRRTGTYDALPALDGNTSSSVVESRTYNVVLAVAPETPQPNATTLTATVTWDALTDAGSFSRSIVCTTILGRGLPPPQPGAGGEPTHPTDDGVNHDE